MRLAALVLVITAALVTPASADTPAPAYRMLTYNIQALPEIALNNQAVYGMSDQRRGHEIAARLKAANYDIVALQEVFDEDVRDALVADLRPTYPTILPKFVGTTLFNEDSGLMLLSKFPVEKVVAPPGYQCHNTDCSAAFTQYKDRGGSDALADKGVGFTRLRTPSGLVSIFLTHMQADDPAAGCAFDCASAIRVKQFKQAVDFVKAWAPSGEAYFLGDLNVVAGTPEYAGRIAGDFGAAGFQDMWKQTSPLDSGISDSPLNSVNGPGSASEKLDYGLMRGDKCVHYQKIERDRFVFEGMIENRYLATDLSDHYGIEMQVGAAFDGCSPARAGTGSWYYFPDGGTYTLGAGSTAYSASDLATPYSGVVAFRGPFYVRTSGALNARRHNGTNADDALVLAQGQTLHVAGGTTYFRFHQRRLTSGAKQALRLRTSPPLPIRLGSETGVGELAPTSVSGEAQDVVFTVEGAGDVRWDSNYTHLSLRRFKVADQNDTGGVDEPHLYVRVDGGAEQHINLGDQDEGQAKILPAAIRDLGFANSVTVRVREEDGGLNGGWDDYGTKTITPGAGDQTLVYQDSSATYHLNYTLG